MCWYQVKCVAIRVAGHVNGLGETKRVNKYGESVAQTIIFLVDMDVKVTNHYHLIFLRPSPTKILRTLPETQSRGQEDDKG